MSLRQALVHLLACLLFAVASATPAFAAPDNQTEHLKKKPKALDEASAKQYVNWDAGTTSLVRISSLVEQEFPRDFNDPNFYCLIHVLKWGDTPAKVDGSNWYVYRSASSRDSGKLGWNEEQFRESRVFGSHKVGLLYVHINVPLVKNDATLLKGSADEQAAMKEAVTPNAEGRIEATSTRGAKLAEVDGYLAELDYTLISYQIDVTAKLPAPIDNLRSVIGLLQGAEAGQVTVTMAKGALYASELFGIVSVPSDIAVTGKLSIESTGATTDLGTHTFDNEGRYMWDISIGVPLKSYKDLEEVEGEFVPKAISRDNILALLNIYPKPVDTKNTKTLRVSGVFGVAVSQRPLDTLVAGATIGLVQIQFLVGYKWVKPELEEGQNIDTRPSRIGSWIFGANVPVRTVVAFFKRGS